MFKKIKNGAFVTANGCSFCDVYMINIDDDRIELSDLNGFVIGTIDHNALYEPIELIPYNDNMMMSGDVITIIKTNGEINEDYFRD